MLAINIGPFFSWLLGILPADDLIFIMPVAAVFAVALYVITKKILVINYLIGIVVTTLVATTILFMPLIILAEFLELDYIKKYLILLGIFIFTFIFSLANSRAMLKFFQESRSFNNAS